MSIIDRPTTVADNPAAPAESLDVFAQATLSGLREEALLRTSSPDTSRCVAANWLPSIDVVCMASAEQLTAPDSQTRIPPPSPEGPSPVQTPPNGEVQTEQTRPGEQTRPSDQTNVSPTAPAQRSPLADEMHRRRLAAEARHNGQPDQPAELARTAQPVAPGQPAAQAHPARPGQPAQPTPERPAQPTEQTQTPTPSDSGRFKFDEREFGEAVRKAEREHKRLILDFGADWCSACRTMERNAWPFVDDAMKDKGIFVKINVDRARELMAQYGVTSLPTTIIAEPGVNGAAPRVLHRYVGSMSASALRQHLNEDLR